MHGEQYMHDKFRRQPTTYYHQDSGIGAAIRSLGERPARVGVIGLGTGTLAAYGRTGDVYRFYDINPQVMQIARTSSPTCPTARRRSRSRSATRA